MDSRVSVYKKTHEFYFDDNKNYMRSLDIMVTTKCSLKCKNCSNLMQYYKNPNNTSHDEILNALKVIDKAVDEISEYRIIGGEPMMNKDWANIVKSIIEMKPEKGFLYILMELHPLETTIKFFKVIKLISSSLIMENFQKYFKIS